MVLVMGHATIQKELVFHSAFSDQCVKERKKGSNGNSHIEGCNHSSLSTTPSFFYVDRSEVSFSVGSCLLPHPDKSFLLLRQIPFIQSYAGDVNRVIHIFEIHVCMIISLLRILRLWVEVEERVKS